ncbi:lytic murein transglycosylase [Vreelandella zhanjiangensis]|uniref:lytic murein transglycosylase n=1 Tax=Vreelandella zhanjiangensis TaxID=1121960 RepID=UPI00402AA5E7
MSLKIDLPLRRVVNHTSLTLSAGLLSMLLSGSLQANPQLMTEVDARGAQELRYANFEQWLNEFRRFAATQGISEATLATALHGVRYRDRVIELDRYQPEFVRPIWEYLDSAASDTRVNTGRERFEENRQTALEMQQRFGVPAEIVVAIWGIESNYGSNFGDFSTIEALATLAYDGRRRDFARGELLAALRIIEQGDISAERMKGSWAGAMGHTQFIPSSFEAYAVDGDGDGHRDIWGSIPDVMASTANYLARAGWQTGQPWGVEVVLPTSFDYSQTERLSSAEWSRQGVRALEGELPDFESAALVIPAGAQGPAFLTGPNFRAILRYNNATSYALAVATLADKIAGRDGIQQSWPRGEAALTRDDVKELQQRLNDAGYGVGGADGVMGPNTREGLRAFQRQQGLTPDAFATQSLLERLRQAR